MLLQAVKDDLKAIINDSVKIENLYGIAEEKALAIQSHVQRELKRVEKQLAELDNRFDKLLSLHVEEAITTDQFKHQKERNAHQQQLLHNKKAELILALEEGKNLAERKEAFRKEVERFIDLDISDEQVLKQVLQRLIQTIEVFEDGKIKINYNLSHTLPSN
ncbi:MULTISPECIES: hypothetical protein [Paenibacillus]|uniref:Uncharacterized protein n=2 Tax=Paenibacillus barengoltzii TaxID=343517 RepID=R9LGZ6_9BACL|nr:MULTISPECIES: hypothetical protein [Paenibacillus]EOS55022.1 hypothetical protein C812_02989 [Paenibacillus barengoltzii G22]SMF64466.1 hypothetical protein SAMN02744124_04170 [Paenibacillus barengoltzii J12]